MENLIMDKVISNICYLVVTTLMGVATFYFKKFLNNKKDFLEKQEKILKLKLGIDQYNKDVSIAKNVVLSIEEIAKSLDWKGAIKHSQALKIIKSKTRLSDNDIDIIIRSTVAELNRDKDKVKTN